VGGRTGTEEQTEEQAGKKGGSRLKENAAADKFPLRKEGLDPKADLNFSPADSSRFCFLVPLLSMELVFLFQ
jgi:hypothetical protein